MSSEIAEGEAADHSCCALCRQTTTYFQGFTVWASAGASFLYCEHNCITDVLDPGGQKAWSQ